MSSVLPSILIVDDEVTLANLFRQYLSNSGFDAVCFTDPFLAFEHFEYNYTRYPIVITDSRMPRLSGLDLANKI